MRRRARPRRAPRAPRGLHSQARPRRAFLQDDGTDKGGGWQEVKANLEFIKKRRGGGSTWFCPFTIGMPLRAEAHGKISASRAASISIDVTEGVAVKMDYSISQGFFCSAFVKGVTAAFRSKYPKLGEIMTQ